MSDRKDQDKGIIGGTGGNTAAGSPGHPGVGEGAGAGAAGSGTEEGELKSAPAREGGERSSDREEPEGLSAGDDSVDSAIGGGSAVSGSGGGIARSGRLSSEGTGTGGASPDPGDPGGMGGVGAGSRTAGDRPPGGVSPMATDESESESEPPRRA